MPFKKIECSAEVIPGDWYEGPRCHHCRKVFPCFHHPEGEPPSSYGEGIGLLPPLTCTICGETSNYRGRELMPVQAAAK